jgi:hypothetical protein
MAISVNPTLSQLCSGHSSELDSIMANLSRLAEGEAIVLTTFDRKVLQVALTGEYVSFIQILIHM